MTKWVQINKNWILRPVIQGWELISCEGERVIELTIEGMDTEVAEWITVLLGEKPIPESEKSFNEFIKRLTELKAITIIDKQPAKRRSLENNENLRKLWQIRKKLVGNNGPVPRVYWIDPYASRIKPVGVYFFSALYTVGQTKNQYDNDWSVGISPILEVAELKAIMEGLERYASGIIPNKELIITTQRQLGDKAIDPRKVVAYTKKQYKSGLLLKPFSKGRPYYWKTVYSFPEKKEYYLPIDCLYYPIPEELISQLYTLANSSGVAAGFSFEDALLRGIYEILERDAFMVVWFNRLVMPTIPKEILSQELKTRIASFEELGYEIYLINLTLDTVPVILGVAVNEKMIPTLVLGMAANFNPEKAISKSLDEILHQLYWNLRPNHSVQTLTNPKEVGDVGGHAALYATPRYLKKASFLWQGKLNDLPRKISFSNELEYIVELLSQKRIQILAADLTPTYFKSVGIWVVRTILPELVPIPFGYRTEPLGMRRIKELPENLGLKTRPWPQRTPFTHPFA